MDSGYVSGHWERAFSDVHRIMNRAITVKDIGLGLYHLNYRRKELARAIA